MRQDCNPVIAFGLLATTVALKAKTGRLKREDKDKLISSADVWCADLPDAQAAVVDFLEAVDAYPLFAGELLQSAARNLVPASTVLPDAAPALDAADRYAAAQGWATRKDCGHG
ncbi:hypothetical protein [uncultured Sulfitobacter sp.]|uniref:hypothetical protein n=1 Tax=uncultured Sulfitobacter sp. TaxID=191468 RepID=UPI00260AF249|nr:hypothetical protein [uncultured Sulfitobacter sp.]